MFDVSNLESIDAVKSGDLIIVLRKDTNGNADILQYDISKITSPDPTISIWEYGPYNPSPLENPAINSFYLNTSNGQIFTTITSNGVTTWNQNSIMTLTGQPGEKGEDGKSAYDIAVAGGYVGTESQWLASLAGPAGNDGTRVYFVYSVPTGVISDSRGLCRPGDYAIVSINGAVASNTDTSEVGETYVYQGAGIWTGPLTISLATTGPVGPAPKISSSKTITATQTSTNTYEFDIVQQYLNLDASTNVNQVIDQGQNVIAFGIKNTDTSEIFTGVNLVNNINTLNFISAGHTALLIESSDGSNVMLSPNGSIFDGGTITSNGSGLLTVAGLSCSSQITLNPLPVDPTATTNTALYSYGSSSGNILKFYDGSKYHKVLTDIDLTNYVTSSGNTTFTGSNTFAATNTFGPNQIFNNAISAKFIYGDISSSTVSLGTSNTTDHTVTTNVYSISTLADMLIGNSITLMTENPDDGGGDAGKFLIYGTSGTAITIPNTTGKYYISVYNNGSRVFNFYGISSGKMVLQSVTLNCGDILILYAQQWIDNNNQGYYYQIIRNDFDSNTINTEISTINSTITSLSNSLQTTTNNQQNYMPLVGTTLTDDFSLVSNNKTLKFDKNGQLWFYDSSTSNNYGANFQTSSGNTTLNLTGPHGSTNLDLSINSETIASIGDSETSFSGDFSVIATETNQVVEFGISSTTGVLFGFSPRTTLSSSNPAYVFGVNSLGFSFESAIDTNRYNQIFGLNNNLLTVNVPLSLDSGNITTDGSGNMTINGDILLPSSKYIYTCGTSGITPELFNGYSSTNLPPNNISICSVNIDYSPNGGFTVFNSTKYGTTSSDYSESSSTLQTSLSFFTVSFSNGGSSTSSIVLEDNYFYVNVDSASISIDSGKNITISDTNLYINDGIIKCERISTSVAEGLTAAGTTISTALALTSATNVLTTVSPGSGVSLPNVAIGTIIKILNRGNSTLLIYPDSTNIQIESLAVGAGQSMVSGGSGSFMKTSSTMWRVV